MWGDGSWLIFVALLVGIAMAWFVARKARQRQMATGQQFPVFWTAVALIVGLPLLAYALSGFPLTFDFPKQSTFNLTGGIRQVKPEFLSLYLALSCYTAAFIAEIVRAGIMGVSKGQTEASGALGLRPGIDPAARRRAAGHAHRHSAADQPVSEPDQELVAGCRHRLSRT